MTEQVNLTGQLKHYFGFDSFKGDQEAIIRNLMSGNDTFVLMPTGGGKSLCYQLPSLIMEGTAIVISPLIALMKNQVDIINGLSESDGVAHYLNSSLNKSAIEKVKNDILNGTTKLLYVAPESLTKEDNVEFLKTVKISFYAIDEAHCISEWGHDFRPSYRLIGEWLDSLPKRPIVGAFTATATKYVENDIKKLLGLDKANVYVTGFDRPNLSFSVIRTPKRMDYVVHYVRQHANENGIIYCATRKDVDRVYENITRAGIKAGHYHGGLNDEVRREMQNAYADDKLQVMVATNAFGMGIDKSNVRYVLHYQMPRNMESYYQEAGRAGRDGAPAECILLYSGQDVQVHKYLIEQSIETPERQNVELRKLQSMIDYCFCSNCLRKYMLNYFGESTVWTTCDNCSSCKGSADKVNVTKEAKAIFRAIMGTDERYGASMITSIVRGERTDRIMRAGHDALPVFGLLSNVDEKSIKGLIQQFVASGYLRSSTGKYPVLSLTAGAEEVLAGRKEVEEIRQHVSVPSRTSKSVTSVARGKSSSTSGGLFEHLRQHRKRLAEEAGLRPYLIFPDTVLIDLANLRPTTLGEFGNVKGVGEAKLKKYGLTFLQAIAEYKG